MFLDGEEIQVEGCVGVDQGEERVCGEWGGGGDQVQSYFDLIVVGGDFLLWNVLWHKLEMFMYAINCHL